MKKYMLFTLFLIIVVASPVLAGGRGRGRGHGASCYKHAQKLERHAFRAPHRRAYRAYPAYGYYQPYPVYVAPAPVYGYYPACPAYPPPPVYQPYYPRPGVSGHVGVDIVF